MHNPSPATILLIDDDKAVRKAVRDMYEEYGFTVLEAETPEAAKALYKENRHALSLIVTDNDSAGGQDKGLEFIRFVRGEERQHGGARLPIILLTGVGSGRIHELTVLMEEAGGEALIAKPSSSEQLYTTAKTLIEASRKSENSVAPQRW